jgi:hypothetical protein
MKINTFLRKLRFTKKLCALNFIYSMTARNNGQKNPEVIL